MKHVHLNFTWSIIACILSYAVNKSVCYAVFHFILGSLYVPYWVCTYSKIPELIMQWVGNVG